MSAVARMIERDGKNWTMYTWVNSGSSNEYGRQTENLSNPITVKGIRSETAKERVMLDVRGQHRTLDVQLLVLSDVDVSHIEDTTKRSPILVSPDGIRYEAIALGREGNIMGFHRIFLSQARVVVS